ncbi:fumarylacetoacetate hydrolase family protein [bacterium]|nr:fumarylacetoacetate hydrolase family protein [bacterium]MCB2201994.1 fumarylacetoacetate hydrolase family protein [bacterium]
MSSRIVRFQQASTAPAYGRLDNDGIYVYSGPPWLGGEKTGEQVDVDTVKILAPVEPSKIVCIGLNYHAHVKASYSADEAPERPLIFLKPPSSIVATHDKIVHPAVSQRVDYEAELGVVIGKRARDVSEDEAPGYIFGCTCVNDVTARDLQKPDGQWSRAKGFDTFCPIGPWIVESFDYSDVLVEGIHNGEVRQSGRTTQMIFKIPFLVSYISSIMTLMPGDIISTGTPSGIAPMTSGDTIEVRVEGLGSLENTMA